MERFLVIRYDGREISRALKSSIAETLNQQVAANNVAMYQYTESEAMCKLGLKEPIDKTLIDNPALIAAKTLNEIVGFSVNLEKSNLKDFKLALLQKVIHASSKEKIVKISDALSTIVRESNPKILASLIKYGFTTDVIKDLDSLKIIVNV